MPAVSKASQILEAREIQFLQSYRRHQNAQRAYRECWPDASYATAATKGPALLKKPRIRAFIDEINAQARDRLRVDAQTVTDEIAKIAFLNPAKFFVIRADGTAHLDLSLLDAEDFAAISEITSEVYLDGEREVKALKVKLAPKTPALDLLGQTLKLFTSKVEVNTTIDIGERIREARLRLRAEKLIDITPEDSG